MEKIDDLLELLEYKENALNYTELRIAKRGDDVPFSLVNEKNTLQNEINSLRSRIKQLKGETADEIISNLPARQPFIGRIQEKETCLNALSQEQQGWGAILDGAGGMGKTALAIEVAHLAKQNGLFDAYLFESAKTTFLTPSGIRTETLRLSSLDSFVRSYAEFLNFPDIADHPNPDERVRLFLSRISGRHILFVVDNMETLPVEERNKVGEFLGRLPSGNKAILTSRIRTGEAAKTIRLVKLSDREVEELIKIVGELLSPSFVNEWKNAEKSMQSKFIAATGGNPLIIRYAIGRIDVEGMRLEKMVNTLQQSPPEDVFSFLFAEAVKSLSNLEIEVLFALTYSEATDLSVLSKLIKVSPEDIQNALAKLTATSLINTSAGDIEKFSLNEVFKNYAVFIAQKSAKSEKYDLNINPNLLAKVSDKVLEYWTDFVEKNGRFDRHGVNNNWDNIATTCQSLYELSGLPTKVTNERMASDLVKIALVLCEIDGPLMSLGLWNECIKIGEWGYVAASKLKDNLSSFILAGYIAEIYFSFKENDKGKEWLEKLQALGRTVNNEKLPSKLEDFHLFVLEGKDRIPYLHKQLEIIGDNTDSDGQIEERVKVLNSLGEAYQETQDFIQADRYYKEAMETIKKIKFNSSFLRSKILINLGNNTLRKKRASFTGKWLERLGSMFPNGWEPPDWAVFPLAIVVGIPALTSFGVEWALNQVGKVLTGHDPSRPDYDVAQSYFERALDIAINHNVVTSEADAQMGLAFILEQKGQRALALNMAKTLRKMFDRRPPVQSKIKELNELISRLEK